MLLSIKTWEIKAFVIDEGKPIIHLHWGNAFLFGALDFGKRLI
jgi:hypothetical protein